LLAAVLKRGNLRLSRLGCLQGCVDGLFAVLNGLENRLPRKLRQKEKQEEKRQRCPKNEAKAWSYDTHCTAFLRLKNVH